MKTKTLNIARKTLSFILCSVLIVAMALFTTGCNDETDKKTTSAKVSTEEKETPGADDAKEEGDSSDANDANSEDTSDADGAKENADSTDTSSEDVTVLGEGNTSFNFTVTDKDGKETKFEIHTDKTTVGEALLEQKLIEGEDSQYGLYVKSVNGISADYDKDGVYWAFYVNGEYAQSGADSTNIKDGDTYSFKVEK